MSNMMKEQINKLEETINVIQENNEKFNKKIEEERNNREKQVEDIIFKVQEQIKNIKPQIQEKEIVIKGDTYIQDELHAIHTMMDKLNLQMQQAEQNIENRYQDNEKKLQLIWSKIGTGQLQGGYKNQVDLLNNIFIQQEALINKVNQIQNVLGTSLMGRKTYSDSINEVRDEIKNYQEQIYSLSQQISPLTEVASLKDLAEQVFKENDIDYKLFIQKIKDVSKIKRRQDNYHIIELGYSYGITDDNIWIEKNYPDMEGEDDWDIRLVYNTKQDQVKVIFDYSPCEQKTYSKLPNYQLTKEIDYQIGGGRYNQPIFINDTEDQQIIEGMNIQGGSFSGNYLFNKCQLKNVNISGMEKRIIEFRECNISHCKIQSQKELNIFASNMINCEIISFDDISINTYQNDEYFDMRYIRQCDVQAIGNKKIVIQSNTNQYGLSINDSKFTVQQNEENGSGVIQFIGNKFLIKNSQFYVIKSNNQIAKQGSIIYTFSQKQQNMNIKSCILKAENIKFKANNIFGKYQLQFKDNNVICKKQTINTNSLKSCIILQVI